MLIRGVRRVPVDVRGRKSVRFRKKSTLCLNVIINKNQTLAKESLVLSIVLSKKLKKLIKVLVTASGSYYALGATTNSNLFNYTSFRYFCAKKSYGSIFFRSFIGFFKKRSFISHLSLDHGEESIYATANGVSAAILSHNFKQNLTLIRLPSGETKYFSTHATASLGKCSFGEYRILKKGDKRFKRLRGFRAKVRGVAMNPIDHPHGGNTKSIRFPRTPWGLATKLK